MNEARLVEVETCQLCGSRSRTEMFREPPFRVLRCADCSLVYVSPRHADDVVHELYDRHYWNSDSPKTRGYARYAEEEPLYLKTFRRRLRLVNDHVPARPLRVLDIGCAAGFFLRVMRDQGHEVRGAELSAEIAAHAVQHLGAENLHIGFLHDLEPDRQGFEHHSFDLVTLWDVVEHVPRPQALMQHVRELLKPDGVLILETQNVDSAFANLLGKRWQHFKHEEHLYHFNPATIRRLLTDTGFQVVRNTPSFGGKYVSLGFIAERAGRLSKAAGLLCKPLNAFGRMSIYLNLRDEMVVVARPSAEFGRTAEVRPDHATAAKH
ncbi:MAG: class I SAM-dependent methyltransferase [Planctomycetes bacterium]|nr:class I SAM-dependent methyltransferase [Planctomycetota bacterium]MCB9871875.1 class I SAM-dependent methyltransferase [Planctomycetota bacterium]MCB9888825.1 class I SAM-dependent methyltransferase [Planctomycetota bacterium]